MTKTKDERPAACERVRTRLLEHATGGLDPVEAARDEGHLEACGACRAVRDTEGPWWRLVVDAHAVDDTTWEAVRAELEHRLTGVPTPGAPRDTGWWVRGAVALAASVAALWLLPRVLPATDGLVRSFQAATEIPSLDLGAPDGAPPGLLDRFAPRLGSEVRR